MALGWYNASASANAATNAMCTTVTRVWLGKKIISDSENHFKENLSDNMKKKLEISRYILYHKILSTSVQGHPS